MNLTNTVQRNVTFASLLCHSSIQNMCNIFQRLKSFHCCFFFDHEKGAICIGIFYILVAFATSAWQIYEFSIPLIYWQVLSLVKNLGLIMGVWRKKIEYFLPWLVVMVAVILIGPVVIIFKFLEYQETREDLLGPVILGIGMSLCK